MPRNSGDNDPVAKHNARNYICQGVSPTKVLYNLFMELRWKPLAEYTNALQRIVLFASFFNGLVCDWLSWILVCQHCELWSQFLRQLQTALLVLSGNQLILSGHLPVRSQSSVDNLSWNFRPVMWLPIVVDGFPQKQGHFLGPKTQYRFTVC